MKKRVLFVDDETNILQGLKRMLRSQRKVWDMAFAESGKEALELLECNSFDAIVSDMRMPGMDGAELLDKVKVLYPEMVRFVLSGHSDQELVMRSVGPSHQYLAKPCEADLLKNKLSDAFTLHELLASDEIRTVVAGMTSLPSLPHLYKKVVDELQSPDGSIFTVGKIIEQDPAMAIKVLQLVNSAYFGIGRQISSPSEAANLIGLDILKSLVLSEGIFSQFNPEIAKILSLDIIKSQSILVAQSARMIAKSVNSEDKLCDQAFLSGLLHELGSLVLAVNLPEEYMRACDISKQEGIDIWHAEKQVFGTTHAEVAAYLLGLWGIDDDVVVAVAYHHQPECYPDTQFSALTAVYVAATCASTTAIAHGSLPFTENGLAYLEEIGVVDRIPEWQKLCNATYEKAA